MPIISTLSPYLAVGMPVRPAVSFCNQYISGLCLHRAPMPEEEPLEPLPGEEPAPDEEEPPPHPDPSVTASQDFSGKMTESSSACYSRVQPRTIH